MQPFVVVLFPQPLQFLGVFVEVVSFAASTFPFVQDFVFFLPNIVFLPFQGLNPCKYILAQIEKIIQKERKTFSCPAALFTPKSKQKTPHKPHKVFFENMSIKKVGHADFFCLIICCFYLVRPTNCNIRQTQRLLLLRLFQPSKQVLFRLLHEQRKRSLRRLERCRFCQ